MSEIQYSPDKPKDCKYCYWYEKRNIWLKQRVVPP